MVDLKAAATVVLIREAHEGIELLLLKRPRHGTFANAWVFPGGSVEVSDVKSDTDSEVDVVRHTAVRETMEETGLDISAADLKQLSVWLPPPSSMPIRFHTWFFLGAAPHTGEVRLPPGEIVEYLWISPSAAMARHGRADIDLLPPTFMAVLGLVGYTTVREALEGTPSGDIPLHESHFKTLAGRPTAVWAGDSEHPSTLNVDGRNRLYMGDRPWRYERTV